MYNIYLHLLFLWIAILSCESNDHLEAFTHSPNDKIRINQLGYYPNSIKRATVVTDTKIVSYKILNTQSKKIVHEGNLGPLKNYKLATEKVQQIDFSNVKESGNYIIFLSNGWVSYPFAIKQNLYSDLLTATAKAYYFQRTGADLSQKHAGKWKRVAGHPDTEVKFHPGAQRKGTISSPKGWYDAGDFGKYIVNGCFSAGQLLMGLERYPNICKDGALNIPESGNGINDLLDEIKYEADWAISMQDPKDGGLHHKLTTKRFSGAIMPESGGKPRFIVAKSTAATLDYAAFIAKMSRHYRSVDAELADTWLSSAKKAWQWAIKNPNVAYKNPEDVKTGEYGDDDFVEEKYWAAAELYVASKEKEYLSYLQNNLPDLTYKIGDGWKSFMRFLGVFVLLNEDSGYPDSDKQILKTRLLKSADELLSVANFNDYNQCVDKFEWGSNSDIQNTAVVLAEAYRIDPKKSYLDAVVASLDYMSGHNAVGYCMYTGFGSKSAKHIHHRQSQADGIEDPIPGFVVGGPNADRQDKNDVPYEKDVGPMKAYLDVWESYASNEICLNWNSPSPFLLAFLEDTFRSKE